MCVHNATNNLRAKHLNLDTASPAFVQSTIEKERTMLAVVPCNNNNNNINNNDNNINNINYSVY